MDIQYQKVGQESKSHMDVTPEKVAAVWEAVRGWEEEYEGPEILCARVLVALANNRRNDRDE